MVPPPQRIAIVGCSGAGKSTLARRIGARLDLPVIHIDTLFWRPGWTQADTAEFQAAANAAAAGEQWVIDGNFDRTGRLRFERAELIVWLEPPMLLCLWRAVWRALTGFGRGLHYVTLKGRRGGSALAAAAVNALAGNALSGKAPG